MQKGSVSSIFLDIETLPVFIDSHLSRLIIVGNAGSSKFPSTFSPTLKPHCMRKRDGLAISLYFAYVSFLKY